MLTFAAMKKRVFLLLKTVLCVVILCTSSAAFATNLQEVTSEPSSDFTTRFGVDIKKSLCKGLSLTWSEEARFKQNSAKFDRLYSGLALSYSVCDYFKLAAGYNYILVLNNNKSYQHRHRVHVDFTGCYGVGQWQFSLRERPMLTQRMGAVNKQTTANPYLELRSRVLAEYSCTNAPLKPFVSFELFNTLNAPKLARGNYVSRLRSEVGLKWTVVAQHTLNLYYRFDVDYSRDIDLENAVLEYGQGYKHILGLAYTFDWK